jgi:polyisoprenoid-binding protein YceI
MKLLQNTCIALALATGLNSSVSASDYIIDTKVGHAGINFKFKHLGISWLTGEFRTFDGTFTYDSKNLEASTVVVSVDVTSLDSGHEIRDEHILGEDYLNAEEYPQAKFVSTSVVDKGHGNMTVLGELSLHGITREIAIEASKVGAGDDPWGGYRVGLEGTTVLDMRNFGYESFGPTHLIEMLLYIEGVDLARTQH